MTREEFIEQKCQYCGSQRCYGEEYCVEYQRKVNEVPLTFTPEEVKQSLEDADIELVDGELNMEKPEFFGEVTVIDVSCKVSREDKKRLVELMSEAKQILNKYPYTLGSVKCARDQAKTSVFDANEWCNCLEVLRD